MVVGSNTDSLVDRKNSDPLGSESIQYSIQDRCVLYSQDNSSLAAKTLNLVDGAVLFDQWSLLVASATCASFLLFSMTIYVRCLYVIVTILLCSYLVMPSSRRCGRSFANETFL